MGFPGRRRGTDGRPRYAAYYRDLRGREVSVGTFARTAGADAAWQAAEAGARAGLRHDPGRGRQGLGHYAGAVWLPVTGWSCLPGRTTRRRSTGT